MMKGLLRKEILTIKKKYGILRILMDLLIMGVMVFVFEGFGALLISFILLPMEAMSMLITLASTDDQWGWNRLAISLPVTKKQIVGAKYIFAAGASCIAAVVGVAANAVAYYVFQQFPWQFHLIVAVAGAALSFIFCILLLPASYSFGTNASVVVMLVFSILALVAGILIRRTGIAMLESLDVSPGVVAVISVLGIAAFAMLSYMLSIQQFRRKHS